VDNSATNDEAPDRMAEGSDKRTADAGTIQPEPHPLQDQGAFFRVIFREFEGVLCVSCKEPATGKWRDYPFPYPERLDDAVALIAEKSPDHETYFSPMLYKSDQIPKGRKSFRVTENVLITPCAWSDLDEVADTTAIKPEPSLLWASSPGRYQTVWLFEGDVAPDEASKDSKRLTYANDGDKGGHGLTKVLRVPLTPNHKYPDRPLIPMPADTGKRYAQAGFDHLADASPNGSGPVKNSSHLPAFDPQRLNGLTAEKVFKAHPDVYGEIAHLFTNKLPKGYRSEPLYEMNCLMFEHGLGDYELMAVDLESAIDKFADKTNHLELLWADIHRAWDHVEEQHKANSPNLPDEFWQARPYLQHIRQAAWSRGRSPDAVLHIHMARISALVQPTLRIEPRIGSVRAPNHYAVVVAPTGKGKSTAKGIALELLPANPGIHTPGHDRRNIPWWHYIDIKLGSGEGLIAAFLEWDPNDKKNVQKYDHGFLYVDEGMSIGPLANRQGATILGTMNEMRFGETVGQHNADKGRWRELREGCYGFGVAIAIQEESAADFFGVRYIGGGFTGRYVWASAVDPSIPPPSQRPQWPGELKWHRPDPKGRKYFKIADEIWREIEDADWQNSRGNTTAPDEDAHAMLLRLIMAVLLAYMAERIDVNAEDWKLAGMMMTTSNAVRKRVQATLKELTARNTRASSIFQVEKEEQADEYRTQKLARKVWEKVKAGDKAKKPITRRELRNNTYVKDRPLFNAAYELALENGWIVEELQPGSSEEKKVVVPGPEKPR
jgi:hypothetical protein